MSVFDENIITEDYLRSRGFKKNKTDYTNGELTPYYTLCILDTGPITFLANYYVGTTNSHYKSDLKLYWYDGEEFKEVIYESIIDTIELETILHKFKDELIRRNNNNRI